MESFENKTPDNKQEQADFKLVGVEQKDGQDTLKIDQQELARIKDFVEKTKMDESDKSYLEARLDGLKVNMDYINSRLDDLMDVTFRDNGEVDIEDGQDTMYLQKVAQELNNAINHSLQELQQSGGFVTDKIDNMFSSVDKTSEKYERVQQLKGFIAQLESRKQEQTRDGILDAVGSSILGSKTMGNIKRRNQLLEGGTKVKF